MPKHLITFKRSGQHGLACLTYKNAGYSPEACLERDRNILSTRCHATVLSLICVLSALLYGWTSDFPFVFDDYYYMTDNPLFLEARSLNHLKDPVGFAAKPINEKSDPDLATNILLRPVAYASLHLNHYFDGFDPAPFRVVNIVVHAINGFLIFALLAILLSTIQQPARLQQGSTVFIAGTAALLFTVHPLATESVTYIIQRFTSLATLFFLLTLLLHFVSLSASSKRHRTLATSGAVASLLLGMLTKEDVFTAPIMAVILDKLILRTTWLGAIRRALPLLCLLPVIPSMVIFISWAQSGATWSLSDSIHIVNSRENPYLWTSYLITQITVVADYLRQILWPSDLNLSPDWPVYHSIFEPTVLASLSICTALIASAGWLYCRRYEPRHGLVLAFALWFFITLAPSSGFVPLPDMKADHRTYLPSIGVLVVLASMLDKWRLKNSNSFPNRWSAACVVFVGLSVFSFATWDRNKVWMTNKRIWEDTLTKSPRRFPAWSNLGAAYCEEGDYDSGSRCFQRALEIEPRFFCALQNLSISLIRMKRWQDCLDTTLPYMQTQEFAAQSPTLIYNIGLSYASLGKLSDAERVFGLLLQLYPKHFQAHKTLGMIYDHRQKNAMAMRHLRLAQQIQPGDQDVERLLLKLSTNSRVTASNF